ncbi:hypothetical protein OUZ56_032189 [Daphnia magna]|uniref:Uncharacterized protein n=1 Tax=Daphnia magna TaxID=35525 RepID=A0ABQ9ZWE8_9CRUS|nr:hypothetical protein OUZ56_032189 [Daphnia magna]
MGSSRDVRRLVTLEVQWMCENYIPYSTFLPSDVRIMAEHPLDIVADMSHPLLGQSCDRGEEIIGRSPLQERYADMQSGRGVIRATV